MLRFDCGNAGVGTVRVDYGILVRRRCDDRVRGVRGLDASSCGWSDNRVNAAAAAVRSTAALFQPSGEVAEEMDLAGSGIEPPEGR